MSQLGVKYTLEKRFYKNYRYDAYVECFDKKYTIEAHGIQHYKTTWFPIDIEEQSRIDYNKRSYSESLGNTHIEVDCRYSEFEHLKHNFILEFEPHFDMTKLNWEKIYKGCSSNKLIEACCVKNENKYATAKEIGVLIGMKTTAVIKYLKRGTILGLCYYNAQDEIDRNNKNKNKQVSKMVVQCDKNMKVIKIFKSIKSAGLELNKSGGNIRQVCMGNSKTAWGYIWYYMENIKNCDNLKTGDRIELKANINMEIRPPSLDGLKDSIEEMMDMRSGKIDKEFVDRIDK